MKAYNISVEGTKYTPHELVFGRSVRVPNSSILPDDKGNESYSEYATTLFNQIFDAQAHEKPAKIRYKRYYDHKANPYVFNKDDYVYLWKELLIGKFDEQYKGLCKILEILENNEISNER